MVKIKNLNIYFRVDFYKLKIIDNVNFQEENKSYIAPRIL
jgi:ABC-type dipeptide/oligopeptide/nickel transport system ATPase component